MPFAIVHLTIAAIWLGSMSYSLAVLQPKVRAFFDDAQRREEFTMSLAHGNRWRVVGLIAALIVTAVATMATTSRAVATGYAVVLGLYALATAIFFCISWRHWPARIFALPEELPGFQVRFRYLAWTMLALVAMAYLTALVVSVGLF
jgi:hypothetical protein